MVYEVYVNATGKCFVCDRDEAVRLLGMTTRGFLAAMRKNSGSLTVNLKAGTVGCCESIELLNDDYRCAYVEAGRQFNANRSEALMKAHQNKSFGFKTKKGMAE